MIQCHERLHTYMKMKMNMNMSMSMHVYTRACACKIDIYKYTCVRVQNRALLNARRANDYTIFEQLVDEIIVISDPLFIDSSVSW